jgi:hypothetical protein
VGRAGECLLKALPPMAGVVSKLRNRKVNCRAERGMQSRGRGT